MIENYHRNWPALAGTHERNDGTRLLIYISHECERVFMVRYAYKFEDTFPSDASSIKSDGTIRFFPEVKYMEIYENTCRFMFSVSLGKLLGSWYTFSRVKINMDSTVLIKRKFKYWFK